MPLTADKNFRVNVSSDLLTATLCAHTEMPPPALSPDDILAQVKELGIFVDEQGYKALEDFAASLTRQAIPEPAVIACGTPPRHDQMGRIEKIYEQAQEDAQDDQPDRQSHYERTNIVMVKKGQQILRLVPPVKGANGKDVYGKEIPHQPAPEAQIRLGSNVRQTGEYIIADCDGVLQWQGEKVWINPKLEISGNVDFSVGNIDFPGDVSVSENVLDLFKVRSGNDIIVRGVAEAAEIHAERDLEVVSGIAGKEKGVFTAGRDLMSKYITNATVRAGRNVVIKTEILQSDLVCGGHLTVEQGAVVGGRTVAAGGAKVKHLGSDANVKTIVELGIDDDLRKKYEEMAPQIKLHRRQAEKIRQNVEPFLRYLKHLTPAQKENTNQLLRQVAELENRIKQMINQLRQAALKANEKTHPEMEVLGAIHPGITIRLPRLEAVIAESLSGPLKLMPRQLNGVLRVAAVDNLNGAVCDLGGMPYENEFWETLDELLHPK